MSAPPFAVLNVKEIIREHLLYSPKMNTLVRREFCSYLWTISLEPWTNALDFCLAVSPKVDIVSANEKCSIN
jgi:hypothetical protein